MEERENILKILRETLQALKRDDAIKLKDLSNQTIHTASIGQDPDNIAVAVVVYSLSKVIERTDYKEKIGWGKFYRNAVHQIQHSIEALEKNNDKHLRKHLEGINRKIGGISGKLNNYIQDVFMKARINKASRIYEHGISMGKTAKLLGVSIWDLAGYAGQTGISNVPLGRTMAPKDRIKIAMEFFK